MKSTTFSPEDRQYSLQKMQSETFDVAIIGGGITGAGVARDAATRGLKVALIEARDFASGTSSRSSKLIHGGIRYLENLEFKLVFEALSERQNLFEIAPHLVHPLRFILPVYRGGRVPAWKMGLGIWLYDVLSMFEAPELGRRLSVSDVEREFPALKTEGLSGAFAYYDAYMDDDRLVLETLRSARRHGVEAVNYVKAVGAQFHERKISAVECEDALTGRRFMLKARHFISSVGPWTDQLGSELLRSWRRTLRLTKGVHLTFDRGRFPLNDAVVMAAEKRIVFAIPRQEMVIVGTTDTDFQSDPGIVRAEPDDVRYLLKVVEDYFPGMHIRAEDIVGSYAGVRPLIDDGAESESKTSREHSIWTDPCGVTFVAGGKYTTYRTMAREVVDEMLAYFPVERRGRLLPSQTLAPLNPLVTSHLLERAQLSIDRWSRQWRVSQNIVQALTVRHGLEAENILALADEWRDRVPDERSWIWCAEALHAVENTMCLHLSDFFFRRTPLVLAHGDHGMEFSKIVGRVMAARLGWSAPQLQEEINALQKQLAWEFAWKAF